MNKGLTIGSLHTENFHISENDTRVMIVSQVNEEVLILGLMLRLQTILAYNNFFICYLAVLQPTLGHYQHYNLTQNNRKLFINFRTKGHQWPCDKVESLSLAKRPYSGLNQESANSMTIKKSYWVTPP